MKKDWAAGVQKRCDKCEREMKPVHAETESELLSMTA
jgi:bacterioferritin-associated ferredoxin